MAEPKKFVAHWATVEKDFLSFTAGFQVQRQHKNLKL